MATRPDAPPASLPNPAGTSAFEVHLENFSGPFDLLLGLISKHKLDITEVALAEVTDEFIAYLRAADAAGGPRWDLGQASGFLVIAATLLDLKAARLLPAGDVEDAEDLELLEARDLLFARLLPARSPRSSRPRPGDFRGPSPSNPPTRPCCPSCCGRSAPPSLPSSPPVRPPRSRPHPRSTSATSMRRS